MKTRWPSQAGVAEACEPFRCCGTKPPRWTSVCQSFCRWPDRSRAHIGPGPDRRPWSGRCDRPKATASHGPAGNVGLPDHVLVAVSSAAAGPAARRQCCRLGPRHQGQSTGTGRMAGKSSPHRCTRCGRKVWLTRLISMNDSHSFISWQVPDPHSYFACSALRANANLCRDNREVR